MKWVHPKANGDCERQPLAELIRDELDEKQCERLATHLDDCETCQQRLTHLAAESDWWLDAGRWLDPAVGDMDSWDEALEGDGFADDDLYYSNAEQELLNSGLLDASDKDGVIGTLGRYEVHRVIGAGGTGIVLKAIDLELNRTVAIKVLLPVLAASGAARRRFAREGQAVAAVAHENVVAVHHVEGAGRLPYLVMQYIDGDSLQDLVVRDGPLDVTTALRMTAQLASALSAAHDQGLVHRDVKPANILVGAAGQRVWITDFGLARAVDDASLTRTGFIAGTPHYMSPEQARGEAIRASSDLFGLGSVLYFVLTGRPPFRAERTLAILTRICNEPHRPVREVNPNVPSAIADLVDRLLSKSAADRIADAETVRTRCLQLLSALTAPDSDLNEIELTDKPVASVNPSVESNDRRGQRRFASGALVILLLVGLFVARSFYLDRAKRMLTDQPDPVDEVAKVEREMFAAPSVTLPIPLPDETVAAGENEFLAAETDGQFPVVAATAEMDARPHSNSTSPLPPILSPPAQWSDEAEPVAFDSASSPRAGDLIALESAPLKAPQSAAQTGIVAEQESCAWSASLSEFRVSLEQFERQIEQHAQVELMDNSSMSPLTRDSFDDELRRMEDSLRMLESGPVSDDSNSGQISTLAFPSSK